MIRTEPLQLTQKEQEELIKEIEEAHAMYEFMEKQRLFRPWMGDSERFMGFTFLHTKALVKHSITLVNLTRWLKGLTIGLLVLTLGHIFIILNTTYYWF